MIRIRYGELMIECDTPEEAVRVISGLELLSASKREQQGRTPTIEDLHSGTLSVADLISGDGKSGLSPNITKEDWRRAELEAMRDTYKM
ncbi:MAG: hypothetical protein DRO39_09485 [Thermoprotei archaeon]|nr:MAG: hypothetical protein DRO39_09485 [Thermoprotei archaeon]